MKIKELIEELERYDENNEVEISINNKTEKDIQIYENNKTIVISESDKKMIKNLQKEVTDLKFEIIKNKTEQYLDLLNLNIPPITRTINI